jgi:F-type H+-transporting ATPase subunit delta
MAENTTVARPYAEALFEAAKVDAQGPEIWGVQLDRLAQLVGMQDVRAAMSDPRLNHAQRYEILVALCQTPLLPGMQNFVNVLIENNRLLMLPIIAQQFQALKDDAQGVAQAEILSAFPLSDEQVSSLVALLEPKFKLKLKPHVTVDASLIGGVRVVVGDHVFDTSVQAQLTRMRDALVA